MIRRLVILALALLPTILTAKQLKSTTPKAVGLSITQLQRADSAILLSVEKGNIPGAVLAIVRHGKMAYLKAYGNRQTYPEPLPMTTEAIFDMASCSKPLSTALCTMLLCERGQLRLTDPVSRYIDGFQDWKDEQGEVTTIRIKHLLTHTSGLKPYVSPAPLAEKYGSPNPEALIKHIATMPRDFCPETDFQYSCLNYITLQAIVEKVSGQSLRTFAQQNIFRPLGMEHTDYLPTEADAAKWKELIAPTTVQSDGTMLHGQVHDPLARVMMGGISGNAGLFTCAQDIAIYCAMLLNHGTWEGRKIISKQTAKAICTVPAFAQAFGRTYGWDVSSPYASCNGELLSCQTFGHTGYTGPSIVIDPVNDLAVILLTNAVHPQDGNSDMIRLRALISNIVAAAIEK